MSKKWFWLVLAVAVVLFALWPSNAFAEGMSQEVAFPGFASADYGMGMGTHSYSGQLITYWWEVSCGPDNVPEGRICIYRRIIMVGWRLSSPEALMRVDFARSSGSYRSFSLAILPAWGQHYPSLVQMDVDYRLWDTIIEGETELFDIHIWGEFLPDTNCPWGLIMSRKVDGTFKFRDNYCGEVPI